jgi:hypothetical protein
MPAFRFTASTAVVLAVLAAGTPASAATCADKPVSARGDPSRFEVVAKAKARGNWRAKVRAMPTLGAAYADFNQALAADYRCTEKDGRYVCVATAHPCRD